MNIIKKSVIAVIGAVPLMLPLGAVVHAQAAPDLQPLQCRHTSDGIFYSSEGCDLAVDKQVSINGGAFVEADTSATAAQAQVGDTVTWKVTVSNNTPDQGSIEFPDPSNPFGLVRVSDILPTAGVSYDGTSYTASVGNYSSNVWEIVLFDTTDPAHTNLPATLTIVTHATATGLYENTAKLSDYNPCTSENTCSWQGGYQDANSANDSNDAWIDPSAKPVVLAQSTTLTNTGSGTALQTIAAGSLIAATAATFLVSRKRAYKTED